MVLLTIRIQLYNGLLWTLLKACYLQLEQWPPPKHNKMRCLKKKKTITDVVLPKIMHPISDVLKSKKSLVWLVISCTAIFCLKPFELFHQFYRTVVPNLVEGLKNAHFRLNIVRFFSQRSKCNQLRAIFLSPFLFSVWLGDDRKHLLSWTLSRWASLGWVDQSNFLMVLSLEDILGQALLS